MQQSGALRSGSDPRKVLGRVPKDLSLFEEGMTSEVLLVATGYMEM